MMHEWWTGWGRVHWDGVWLDPLLMLMLLAALVAGIVALIRRLRSGGRGIGSPARPLAQGEIDKDDYDKRHKGADA